MKLSSAPVFMHFPAKGKHKKGDTLDIQRWDSVEMEHEIKFHVCH